MAAGSKAIGVKDWLHITRIDDLRYRGIVGKMSFNNNRRFISATHEGNRDSEAEDKYGFLQLHFDGTRIFEFHASIVYEKNLQGTTDVIGSISFNLSCFTRKPFTLVAT